MGLLSSTVSITRYKIEGKIEEPVIETVCNGLEENSIRVTDDDISEKTVGWTSLENPFDPRFKGSSFLVGTHFVFSLRIDRKTIPPKVIKKHYAAEVVKHLRESGRQYLSRTEKKMIREDVINALVLRIPSTPNIYDIIWNYENFSLWFFSNLKSANEELETLFSTSFKLTLVRLFPFTMAELIADLSASERDVLAKLSPTNFAG